MRETNAPAGTLQMLTKSMIPRKDRAATIVPTSTMSGREDPILTGIATSDPITTEKAVADTGPARITTVKVVEDIIAAKAAVMTAAVVDTTAVAVVVTTVAVVVMTAVAVVATTVVAAADTTAAVVVAITAAAVVAAITAAVAAVDTIAVAVVTAAAREGRAAAVNADLLRPSRITKYTLSPCCPLLK
ncbi:hypothetical protein LX66_1577 [Chitinophaga japonensis]|uniref:Uncharacterized protein n=1 Tax=Chitinophaga japonensis TaxID=104662 RepID=A0A562TFP1_CHIJA|nr:hypothetical protein LX66_1577 [Chitinophaga japonensis]